MTRRVTARRLWTAVRRRALAVLAFLAALAVAAKDADVVALVPDRWRPWVLGAAAAILLFSRAVHESHPDTPQGGADAD